MVARMKKFTFLVFHRDYDTFLLELRELGMIHVVEQDRKALDNEELQQFIAETHRLNEAKKTLQKAIDKKSLLPPNPVSVEEGMMIPDRIAKIENEKSTLAQQLQVSLRERETLRPWGNFDPENIARLEEAGYHVSLLIAPDRAYNPEWENQYNAMIIHKEGSKTYFITITKEGNLADKLNLEEMKRPKLSLEELDRLIASLKKQIIEKRKRYGS